MQFNGASYEGYVAVLETNGAGIPLWVSAGMGDLVGDIDISDDGLTIAACSWGYMNDAAPDIRVFQKYNSTPFYQYTHPGSPNDMDISADGTHLIAGGKAVHNRTFGNGGYAFCFSLDLEGGSAAGTVTLAGTTDYTGVTVEAAGTHLSASTGIGGTYQIDHIPAGTYTLTARKLGYTWGTAAGVVITEDGLTSNINFNLSETETAPQNLVAVSGQISSIALSWNPLGTFAQRARGRDALDATGDLAGSPTGEGPLWTAPGNMWGSEGEDRDRQPRSLDDPDSIHIWRAPLSGGPYALVGSIAGTATTYADSIGIWPAYTYYYAVTAVYSDGESNYSNEVAGALDDSYLIYDPVVPEYTTPVTFDGVISANEWTDAVRIDISDVFGYDGVNPPQSAYLYMKYNDEDDLLYLACEDFLNTALDDGEGFGIYVDDDDSDTWSYDRSGSEGNYWAYYYSSGSTLRYRSLSGAPYNADPYFTFANPQLAFSVASGHFSGEVAIPMGFDELYQMALYGPDKTPGIGFFVIQRQAGNPVFDGWWPQNIPSIVSNPEYFSNSSVQATLHVPPAAPSNVEVSRDGMALQVQWIDPSPE
ncbi:MAG: carboxypeptidase regulatory-like domain-containing protein [bacterium]|nr:carboxypeptidase regulatory-like domain-containing protein [bacterium]